MNKTIRHIIIMLLVSTLVGLLYSNNLSGIRLPNAVYITPSGTQYHYSSSCGGKNSFEITLEDAMKKGYAPCKKCVK